MAEKKNYSSQNITVLEGLEAVRLRPGMYIGTTSQRGLHHILWEIVDNAVDEVANGHGNKIVVTLKKDNIASVEDNGRGIPVDLHPTKKISGVEVVFTQLHAGGKFSDENYNFSGGLHGVGSSVTNALSKWLICEVFKDKKHYKAEFQSYTDAKGKVHAGAIKKALEQIGTTKKSGTLVTFCPDETIFETCEFSFDTVSRRLREMAFLNKGITIELIDERFSEKIARSYLYEGGVKDFCTYLNDSKEVLYAEPIYITHSSPSFLLECAIQHNTSYNESIYSYVNNINTPEGGMHETGFKSALTKTLNELARKNGILKDKDPNFMGEDFREGLTCVLLVKMKNVQFEGQTKTKLGNPEAKTLVDSIISQTLDEFFAIKKNLPVLEKILKKSQEAAKVRESARKAKEIARQKNTIESGSLVGKLSGCSGKKAEKNELFIVEGDSAGGSAKQGRDRNFQAILPLKGKPLNVEKKRIDQVLANEEIVTIIKALGAGIGEDFNASDLNYHKVIILSDADQDGAHIRAILLTFFFRYMRQLVSDGFIYIGMPPLYKVYKNNIEEYAYSDKELDACIKKVGRGYQIQRYKGLGEMNPDQLYATTLNPETRSLMQVTIEDAAQAEMLITTLMGDNAESRKNYIFDYADFNRSLEAELENFGKKS